MQTQQLAMTISEFCAAHRLSRGTFYAMLHNGEAPDTIRIGRRVLISCEAAAAWRERMTQHTAPVPALLERSRDTAA